MLFRSNTVNLKFSAGTSVAVIAAVLVAISIQGTAVVSAICWALGSAIVGTAIAQSIDGTVRRQIRQWDYRVIVKNIITFTSYKQDYYARVVNAKTGAISMKDMGKVMGIVSDATKGKADTKHVADLVKKALN